MLYVVCTAGLLVTKQNGSINRSSPTRTAINRTLPLHCLSTTTSFAASVARKGAIRGLEIVSGSRVTPLRVPTTTTANGVGGTGRTAAEASGQVLLPF